MKRATGLLLASFALVVLLAACGGEEETGVLAVAFRLDGESPILCAYVGDPAEDPWELPAGPYYIEAVDQDDVAISLGAVDIEAGDVVGFPPSFDAAGGVADPEHAESLKTVANFLIDFELSEYVFLEAVTAGFTEFPFDPAVEADEADVQELFDIYAEMLAQQDAVEAAFSQIEGRAEVSLGVSYVRSPWAPAPRFPQVAKKKLYDWSKGTYSFFYDVLVGDNRKCILEIVDKIPQEKREEIFSKLSYDKKGDAASFDDWVKKVKEDDSFLIKEGLGISLELGGLAPMAVYESGHEPRKRLAETGPKAAKYATEKVVEAYRHVPGVKRVFELGDKAKEWAEYAEKLLKKPGVTLEETARGKAQQALEDKIKSNLKERYPHLPDKAIDALAQYFAKKAVKAVPRLARTATPAAAAPKTTPGATPKATPKATPAPTPTPTPVATPTPAPDSEWLVPGSGWIEGYVQGIANEWVAKCFKGDVKPYADALRQSLINAMMDGATEEQAKADCPPDVYAPTLPDAGWIEEYVGGIADQWLAKEIYSGFDVAVAADDMRQCLTDRFLNLCFSEEESKAECPAWLFEPVLTPEATATPTPTPEPTPTPQPTETPTPEGGQVTAVGEYTGDPFSDFVWVENKVTLVFDTRGGPIISGEGHFRWEDPAAPCPYWRDYTYHYTGNYSPDSKTLSGTWENEWVIQGYHWRVDEGCVDVEENRTSGNDSGEWGAKLEDGVVRATKGRPFTLTVQG